MSVTDELRDRRRELRAAADELVIRAADESRDLTAEELSDYQSRVQEEREVQERIEEMRDAEVRELRAAGIRTPDPDEEQYPLGAWLTRAISTDDAGAGQSFAPSEFPATFFDKLSATSVLLRSGVRVVTTERASVTFPRWVSDTSATFVAEGDPISSTDADADVVVAVPRKIAALQEITNEALSDSNPSIGEVIASGLVRSLALGFDKAAFEGDGTPPNIQGLAGVTDVQHGDDLTTVSSLDPFAEAIGALEAENATPGAFVVASDVWSQLLLIKNDSTDSNKPVLQDAAGSGSQAVGRQIYGVPLHVSSQLAPGSGFAFDPSQIIVVRRQDVSVEVDRSRLFNTDSSEIRAIMRADVVVPNPAAVVVFDGESS